MKLKQLVSMDNLFCQYICPFVLNFSANPSIIYFNHLNKSCLLLEVDTQTLLCFNLGDDKNPFSHFNICLSTPHLD